MTHQERVLVVEDDEAMRASCRQALEGGGYQVIEAGSPSEARGSLLREDLGIVITDLRMLDGGGQEVVRMAREVSPGLPVMIITAYPTVESAVDALKSGVVDYMLKPFTDDQLLEAVDSALSSGRARDRAELWRRMGAPRSEFPDMIGSSGAFHDMLTETRRIAPLEGHVLISGETGSGKEPAARAIHHLSRRAGRPFVVVNCAAVPDTLFESEMFGYEKGAFTGADAAKPGLVEQAHGGSLFLDEVAELSPGAQAKLLRVVEEESCRRVGGIKPRPADVRVLAATGKDLRDEIRSKRFREDLFFRLSGLEIRVPPLRERGEDIAALAIVFLDRLCSQEGRTDIVGFSEEALSLLAEHRWPGNVRELQNAVQKAFARTVGPVISAEDLTESGAIRPLPIGQGRSSSRHKALGNFEREYLIRALQRHQGNVTHTARTLGIHRTTLQRLMKKHAINSDD